MAAALNLTPADVNYLNSRLIYEQLTQNKELLTLFNSDISILGPAPFSIYLDGSGRAQLGGVVIISANPTAGQILCELPAKFRVPHDYYLPAVVLRAGVYVQNAIHINSIPGNNGLIQVSIVNAPTVGDVVYLEGTAQFLLSSYN